MNKQKLKKVFKFVGIKALGAFIFVAVAGTSIWALAAFSEPTTSPGDSVQDWAKNIMGANNSDNAFDSGFVTANSDGSIVERLEAIESKMSGGGVTAMSARSGSSMAHDLAAQYCFDLAAIAEVANTGSDTSTTYTDWRLGSISEMSIFEETVGDNNYLWTSTPYEATDTHWLTVKLTYGYWSHYYYYNGQYVRCVR